MTRALQTPVSKQLTIATLDDWSCHVNRSLPDLTAQPDGTQFTVTINLRDAQGNISLNDRSVVTMNFADLTSQEQTIITNFHKMVLSYAAGRGFLPPGTDAPGSL